MTQQWTPGKGDQFVHAIDYFGKIHTVSRRTESKKTGQIFIYDENGSKYPIDQCHPYNPDRTLNEHELNTLQTILIGAIERRAKEELQILQGNITPDQRKQLWDWMDCEVKELIKGLTQKQPPIATSSSTEGLRTIVAGSRTITDYSLVKQAILDSGFKISVLISGKEPNGVDALGERWAKENGVPIEEYAPEWDKHGKAAGPIRNKKMIVEGKAEALVLVWTGKTPGSKNMLANAIEHGLQIHQVNLSQMEAIA